MKAFFVAVFTSNIVTSAGSLLADQSASDLALGSADQIAKANVGIKSGSLVVAPIPFSNPILGQGLTLGAGYLFTLPGSKGNGLP